MNILVVIPDLYGSGGAEAFTLKIMNQISSRGHEVHVLTTSDEEALETEDLVMHNDIDRCRLLSGAPLDILRKSIEIDPDIIHLIHAYPTAVWYWPCSYLLPAKVICSAMGDDIQKNEQRNYGIRTNKLKSILLERSLKVIDGLTVFGNHMLEIGIDSGAEEDIVHSINNPVPNLELPAEEYLSQVRQKYQIDTSDFNILYVGRFHEKKNLRELLSLSQELSDEHQVLLVGNGEEGEQLRHCVEEEDIRNVEFLGAIYGSEKHALYQICDLLVLPSIVEGMPTVLVEAARNDMPILASDIPGNKSVTDQYSKGYLYEIGNLENMKSKVAEIKEAQLPESVELESDFSVSGTVDRILRIYSD